MANDSETIENKKQLGRGASIGLDTIFLWEGTSDMVDRSTLNSTSIRKMVAGMNAGML